ncbi:hypothetical protein RA307_12210 [Xanthobacteraceae bacterium Astr-EGSB]|uniref:hypothetical protein n=1 Tax=Astrobacterium formosum TaxID=3069710 RepID=UPI0027B04FFD|nr:hypothetical protein [Xanthobacteraceae bacterium Astr-EGSB]
MKILRDRIRWRRPALPRTFPDLTSAGSVILLVLLAGCASKGNDGKFFDYTSPPPQAAEAPKVKSKGPTEAPKPQSAATLLGAFQMGSDYAVQPDVASDGRYNVYTFTTKAGSYTVTGDGLARKHIQELLALEALKKRSPAGEFIQGAGGAVVSPVVAVYRTVTDPVGATKAGYSNIKRKVHSVQRGVSGAGEFITTLGHPEQKQPDREDDSLIETFVGIPKTKRRLAAQLKVDPYTHYVPLAGELDKVATYSAAGGFGIDKAIGFVPGVGGAIISGLGTLDSVTERTLDMDPSESAAVNRDRLASLHVPQETIKRLLLTDKLTPTEKTQAVGYLISLSGTPGLNDFAGFIASNDTRTSAFAALQTLAYLSFRPFGVERIDKVQIIEGVPILGVGGNKKIAIFTADELAWTSRNADWLSRLDRSLTSSREKGWQKEIRISGGASVLAKQELRSHGWTVKVNTFANVL